MTSSSIKRLIYKQLPYLTHSTFTTATNHNEQLLKRITTTMIILPTMDPKDQAIQLIMHEIRNINPSKSTDTINNIASDFIFQHYARQTIQQDNQTMINDMNIGYNLLQHVIDNNSDTFECKLALQTKTQYAMYLCHTDILQTSFDTLLQYELTKHQISSLCSNLCLYGYWDKLSHIVNIARQQNAHETHDLSQFFNVNNLCEQYGMHQNKQYKPWSHSRKYAVKEVMRRLKDINGDSDEMKNEILNEIKCVNGMSDNELYDIWMSSIMKNDDYLVMKNVSICEMIGMTQNEMVLAGPWFDDKIVVTGSCTVNQNEKVATVENEFLYLEKDYEESEMENIWKGYYRIGYDKYVKNLINWKFIENSVTVTYDCAMILQ
eukprot:435089_1